MNNIKFFILVLFFHVSKVFSGVLFAISIYNYFFKETKFEVLFPISLALLFAALGWGIPFALNKYKN